MIRVSQQAATRSERRTLRIAHEPGLPSVAPKEGIVEQGVRRVLDIVGSLLLLLLTAPALAAIAIATKLTTPGPVLYRHDRLGRNGRTIPVLKFRTMAANADELLFQVLRDDPAARQEFREFHKLKNDPRVTRVGRFLRAASLDELPQLFNVLRGEMSLVGPRPIVPAEREKYGPEFDLLLTVKPGVTGLWQISGRNDLPYKHRVMLDVAYVLSRSLLGDLVILLRTPLVALRWTSSGAY
jgi:lipopolysaccharide/colanic/teichoic acid biosynthesis glycosyltransferase